MLSRVEFQNYRGFKSYRMEGLARVNLLVGKNNSGKTAALEGIQFLASGGSPSVLEEIAIRRGELITSSSDGPFVDPSHFFYGHVLSSEVSVSISGDNGFRPVKLRVIEKKPDRKTSDQESERHPRARYSSTALKIEGGMQEDGDTRETRLTREGGLVIDSLIRSRRYGLPYRPDRELVRFIGTDSIDAPRLAAMWDEIAINGLESDVIEALRVVDESVKSIHVLTGAIALAVYGGRGGFVVGLGARQRVPLGSMGDGMRRILALATSLACTRNGALFADEIDTGLHYSIMTDMWRLVVRRAIDANVQVFASTHSWDCIEGLSLLCQRKPELAQEVAIHTIDAQLPFSVGYSGDAVQRMDKRLVDPR